MIWMKIECSTGWNDSLDLSSGPGSAESHLTAPRSATASLSWVLPLQVSADAVPSAWSAGPSPGSPALLAPHL